MKITFLKTPKPRRFNHVNIYYDPEAEARREREARVRKDLGLPSEDGEFHTSIRRGTFRRLHERGEEGMSASDARVERRRSSIRLAVIIVVLLLVAYLLYSTSGDFLAM